MSLRRSLCISEPHSLVAPDYSMASVSRQDKTTGPGAGQKNTSSIHLGSAGRTFLARDPDGHALYISQLFDGVKALRRQYGIDR